jgi:hypothetical protein
MLMHYLLAEMSKKDEKSAKKTPMCLLKKYLR